MANFYINFSALKGFHCFQYFQATQKNEQPSTVGTLKNCAMFHRLASYAIIQLGFLTLERVHKREAFKHTRAHTKLSLVRRDKFSSKGFLPPVCLPLENEGKLSKPVYVNVLCPPLFWLWGLS